MPLHGCSSQIFSFYLPKYAISCHDNPALSRVLFSSLCFGKLLHLFCDWFRESFASSDWFWERKGGFILFWECFWILIMFWLHIGWFFILSSIEEKRKLHSFLNNLKLLLWMVYEWFSMLKQNDFYDMLYEWFCML